MEYADEGSLYEFEKSHKLTEEEYENFINDVSEGMKHAHKVGLINLDMKSPNILVKWS